MCLVVYLASSMPLNLVPWQEAVRGFHVTEISWWKREVKGQFTLPFAYYAGSDTGCGCGFLKDGEAGEDLERAEENYARLAAYARAALEAGAELQVFSCWDGDQGATPEFVEEIAVETLLESDFVFKEKALYRLTKDFKSQISNLKS